MEIVQETIDVPSADGDAAAYLARPTEGRHPAVLLIPDVFGLRPQIRAMCARVASWGYTVLAPNLVYRDHGLPLIPMMNLRDPDKMMSALQTTYAWTVAVPFADTVADARAWFGWLGEQASVAPGPVGVVGYCRGGVLALLVAENLDAVGAVAAFHPGGLASEDADSPYRHVERIGGEVLVRFADGDPGAPREGQDAFASGLAAAGVRSSVALYPGAEHGFTMADTPRFDAATAERHYEELRDLLDRALAASS